MTHQHTENQIEGLIFKEEDGTWTAEFNNFGKPLRSRIDFCPWCGERLT